MSEGLTVVGRFKLELQERVAETLRSVCDTFEQDLEQAVQPSELSQLDYDTYNDCCQRLVRYITASMDTSPYFTQQMDRIIMACHSDTSAQVLGSLVTKDVWLRPKGRDEEVLAEAKETVVKVEGTQVDVPSSTESLSLHAEAKTDPSRTSRSLSLARKSVPATREKISSTCESSRKRVLETRTVISAKRLRLEEPAIEISSTENEDSGDDGRGDLSLFGADTETEDESSSMEFGVGEDDEKDELWLGSENEEQEVDSDDSEGEEILTRSPQVDIVGKLCHPEGRSARQTKGFKDRLSKSMPLVDALLCRPPPGKVCLQNCENLRKQVWCQNVTTCRNEMCQLWHEVDAHVLCCKNKECEYASQVTLHEKLHQIEQQHERIGNIRRELKSRRKDLIKSESRPSDPPNNKLLLKKQVDLLKRELDSELGQMEFYLCMKRSSTAALTKSGIDVAALLTDFQKHYAAREASPFSTKQGLLKGGSLSVAHQSIKDDLLPTVDDAIGKLCYIGQRSLEQTQIFKTFLRKSIVFVDALLCKPPPGKVCVRSCKRIRANRCTKDVPCDDEMCRTWHNAEAHTDNCNNPQCEFKLRIVLREIMHGIEIKERTVQEECANVRKKKTKLGVLKSDADNFRQENSCLGDPNPRQHDIFLESEILQDEIDQLAEDLQKEERLLKDLDNQRMSLEEKLYAIGIDENDDVTDGFPGFATHYEIKRRPRKL